MFPSLAGFVTFPEAILYCWPHVFVASSQNFLQVFVFYFNSLVFILYMFFSLVSSYLFFLVLPTEGPDSVLCYFNFFISPWWGKYIMCRSLFVTITTLVISFCILCLIRPSSTIFVAFFKLLMYLIHIFLCFVKFKVFTVFCF